MSLQAKFAVLLTLIALVVVGSLATLLWSFRVIERETIEPFVSMTDALEVLGKVKREVERKATLLLGPPNWGEGTDEAPGDSQVGSRGEASGVRGLRAQLNEPPDRSGIAEPFERSTHRIHEHLDRLEEVSGWRVRTGQITSINLRHRIDAALGDAREWLAGGDDAARLRAGAGLFTIHELIERMEGRILVDAGLARSFSVRLRGRIYGVLALALALVVLLGVLGVILVRRWVVRPVQSLRIAADRIARGDFAHRIEVVGGDELAQLAGEVNHMAQMVKSLQDERVESERLAAVGSMVRRIAHNIRNPLAGIRGLAEITRSELDGELRENQTRIVAAVDRFEQWLKELLDATRPPVIEFGEHAIAPWLRGVIEAHQPMGQARQVELVWSVAPGLDTARFDARQLEQAAAALVANAIAASPVGGRVTVGALRSENGWIIEVADTGPGIADELFDRIFAPYFTTKADGTGIGLAIAQQVARAHGGSIHVQNRESASQNGQTEAGEASGAIFSITLPIEPRGPDEYDRARCGQDGAHGGQYSRH